MKRNNLRLNRSLAFLISLTIGFSVFISCAGHLKDTKKSEPAEHYRVALLNAGTYKAIYDQAVMDLSGFRQISLVMGNDLESALSKYGTSTRTLTEAQTFDELARVQGLDFAIVLMPPPPSYVSGSVGLRTVNWRTKTIRTISGVKVPDQSVQWLLQGKNGWVRFTSDPPGAEVTVNDKPYGTTPILIMLDLVKFRVNFQWTPKYAKTMDVYVDDNNWVHARAPGEYLVKFEKKGWYARAQSADSTYGEPVFIVFYVLVMLAGTAMLFLYTPKLK